MKCQHCGSSNIITGIAWRKSNESGNIGLIYKKIVNHVAEVYSDLCQDCGTIVRSYIKDDTNLNWRR